MNTHVMIDCETLGLCARPAIFQIAAVAFDPAVGTAGPEFSMFVRNPSGAVDVATAMWWLSQPTAQTTAARWGVEAYDEVDALTWLSEFIAGTSNLAGVWSHGATADLVWLTETFRGVGIAKPWSYRLERDTRTLFALTGGAPAIERDPATAHDALADCRYQVARVVAAVAKLPTEMRALL